MDSARYIFCGLKIDSEKGGENSLKNVLDKRIGKKLKSSDIVDIFNLC